MDGKAPWVWAKRIVAGFFLLLFAAVAWCCYAKLDEFLWRSHRMRIRNDLTELTWAFLAFEEEHGALPMPAAYRTPEGKPGLSWRVALLPYVGEAELHARFRLDEPWDSPHNLALLPEMPRVYRQKPVYRFSSEPAENLRGETFYQVIRGRGFLFDGHFADTWQVAGSEWLGRGLVGLDTQTQRIVLLVMGRTAVPWTKPEDIDAEDGEPIGPRLMLSRRYYHLAQLDSRHGGLNKETTEEDWRAILRIGEQ